MCHKRLLKVFLVVLALALWAGTANAATSAAGPVALTFTPGGTNTSTGTSAITGTAGGDSYTVDAGVYGPGGSNWITSVAGAGTTFPDTLTVTLDTTQAATLGAGSYSATVTVTDTSDSTTATLTVNLTVTSSLSAGAPGSTSLTWVYNGAPTQAASTTTVNITNTDASDDTFTVTKGAFCPNWLTVTASKPGPPLKAKSGAGNNNVITLAIDPTNFGGTTTANIANCTVSFNYNGLPFSAAPSTAVLTFAKLAIVSQPLLATNPTAVLKYDKGTSAASPSSTTVTVSVATGTPSGPLFYLDLATMPAWLTVNSGLSAQNGANAIVAGSPVTFGLISSVASAMATGNYTAQVGFYETGFPDLYVPVTLMVSNAAPGVTLSPATNQNVPYIVGSATPTPGWTLYSTNEPIPFTATCTVLHPGGYTASVNFPTQPCILAGSTGATANVVNGTTFTWGYSLSATLDPNLFAVTIGNQVTVTLTFSNMTTTAPGPVSFVYTIQPGVATAATTTTPSSVSATFPKSSATVVMVKGTNFVGTASIAGTAVVQTQVWVNTGTGSALLTPTNAATVGTYTVVDSSHILLTLAAGTLPTPLAGKTSPVTVGVANQIGLLAPTAPQATSTLTVTYAPVIYAITNTASFSQPAKLGDLQSLAPYELISIFGDNFGLTQAIPSATASFDAWGKIVSPLTLIPAVGTTKAVTLTVTFKDAAKGTTSFTAPVLFANQNQINAIVPAGVVGNQNVTVTAAGATSDNYLTGTVSADPGVFTLNSDGIGPGAIINNDLSINGSSHKAKANDIIQIYMTGLGAPDSTALDTAPSIVQNFPGTCVEINGTANAPGLIQVVNLKGTGYTAPTAWTNIDGAVMNYGPHAIVPGTAPNTNLPPCMATAAITVTFGSSANQLVVSGASIQYAGFVGSSIAGLYQLNVALPASLNGTGGSALTGQQPVVVTITPSGGSPISSQSGVTMYFN